ncbi:serine/threonine-protein kinase [Nocardia brasiliensis]|uniref:serine/threonine-protein kinase n=1 Tax=Nocardia brasiliensis TaxID=37326 RepID=UPI001894E8AD|nr:serine/threonine-protein kinase [Nocardia brasiliensis]MBF6546077.1 serine/threonine protein kinase [Nocardia brasiliensis]
MVTRLEPADPTQIGRYRLLGELGAGAMGRVLLGVGPDGRLVAIKQVHAHLVDEADFLPRFRREVQTSTRVSGAFTAAVVDFDVDSEMPWLASVFVPGVPLDKAVKEYGPLDTDQIRTLAVGLASALHAIHGVGLIHRDLKPANVILAEDGPRVIDFGIARAAEGRSELTGTGSIIGSPAFMSPEQAESLPLTPASDIFSLGAVLAMAAGGTSPFAGSSLPTTLYNIVHVDPDLTGLPAEVRALVEPCLAKDPQARPTPGQILDFLGGVRTGGALWPAAVHDAIRRQDAELSALRSDPEATQFTSVGAAAPPAQPGGDFDTRLGQLVAAARITDERRRRARLRIGALAGAVLLVVAMVAGAIAWGGDEESTAPQANSLGALNLTKLRAVDLCAAMKEPLVPALGDWTQKPLSTRWGTCGAAAGGYQFSFDIARTEGFVETGATVDGAPVLRDTAAPAGTCGRALLPAATEPQFAVVARVQGAGAADELCSVADEAVTRFAPRLAGGGPKLPDVRRSLARLDPCALVDVDVAKLSIGRQLRGDADTLHSCKWAGGNTVAVRLERTAPPAETPKPIVIDLGGGNIVNIDEQELSAPACVRQAVYRPGREGTAEVVTVQVENPAMAAHPEFKCLAAQDILRNIMGNLPVVR